MIKLNFKFQILNFKFFCGISLLFVLSISMIPAKIFAQSANDKYIWEHTSPQSISPSADDLKQKLELEVQKVINSGHLAPFRTNYGEGPSHYYWYHAYDAVYTLSLAYPYVSTALQNSIKTYLQSEMASYKPWTTTLLDSQTGTKREPDELTSSERDSISSDYNTRPRLFGLYALWLYSFNSGDWSIVDANWAAIKSFYQAYQTEASQHYTSLAGAIGMARIANKKNDTLLSSIVTTINNGLTSATNFNQFALNSENAYKWNANGWDFTKSEIFRGFHFLDITPEIGRFMSDNPNLKPAVLGNSAQAETYTLARGEYFYPLWHMAQSPLWSRYYGEGSGNPPDSRAMIFPVKAWVQKEPANKLRSYLDVPDATVGDYYYMQNLVRTIEAHGSECWKDIRNSNSTCNTLGANVERPKSFIEKLFQFIH